MLMDINKRSKGIRKGQLNYPVTVCNTTGSYITNENEILTA